MVLMALDAAGDHTRDASALAWLHTQQQPDGGFPYSGSPSDPDSTALVLQAIVATGQDPQGPAWAVAGHSPRGPRGHPGQQRRLHLPRQPRSRSLHHQPGPPALERVAFPVPFGQHAFYIAGATLSGNGPPPAPCPGRPRCRPAWSPTRVGAHPGGPRRSDRPDRRANLSGDPLPISTAVSHPQSVGRIGSHRSTDPLAAGDRRLGSGWAPCARRIPPRRPRRGCRHRWWERVGGSETLT